MFAKHFILILISLILTGVAMGQLNEQKSLSVTVYNSNLGVVKDVRKINIPEGNSKIEITDVAQQIDPTSVHIKLDGNVIEQNYQYDLISLNKILQKYLGRNIQLIGEKNELIEGTLLSNYGGQIVIKKKDGGLVMLPSVAKYRFNVGTLPEGLITKPTLVWLVNSNSNGNQDVEISYQTKGMNWHAEYVAVLNKDDNQLDLNSWVSVENTSGTTFKNAKLKLVAGDVNLLQNRSPYPTQYDKVYKSANMAAEQQFKEKEFFEYHIYNLQRPTTLANNETKQISLFEANGVKAHKKYFYGSGGYYGYRNQNSKGKVAVIVEFENKKENGLGIPMPKGKIRMYKSDGESLEFIGEDLIDHTPKNEKIKIKIGDAFDILAEEKQTDHKRITDRVYEEAYEVTITNRKNEDVTVEVERNLGFDWEILNSSLPYNKKNVSTVTFNVPVKKDSKTKLNYRVRYVH